MIPTQTKNPKGLHCRYIVKHIDGSPTYNCPEYFVLRLDNRSENKAHVEACRLAVLAYADAIAANEPELAEDLYKRYNKSVVDNKTKLKPELRVVNYPTNAEIAEAKRLYENTNHGF